MDQKEVAFALKLVAEVMKRQRSTDPEDSDACSLSTLCEVSDELVGMADKLDAAPTQPPSEWCEEPDDRWSGTRCVYHPFGGPDCDL